MPQSFASIPIHLIWSTRDRLPFIRSEIEKELFSYMAFIFREYESPALTINGTADHVHILSVFSRKITIAKLVEVVKKNSSKWIKTKGESYHEFYWQSGYAALGIGQSNIEALKKYISKQKEHHRKKTFQQEYIEFLLKYNIEYDARYIWD
jgi:REP element-mobilizing transposase RayT